MIVVRLDGNRLPALSPYFILINENKEFEELDIPTSFFLNMEKSECEYLIKKNRVQDCTCSRKKK